jgi:hypothetical protein
MMVAEELEVEWSTIEVEQAPCKPAIYRNLRTGGSGGVVHMFEPMRRAGAQAREMLTGAAAADSRDPALVSRPPLGRARRWHGAADESPPAQGRQAARPGVTAQLAARQTDRSLFVGDGPIRSRVCSDSSESDGTHARSSFGVEREALDEGTAAARADRPPRAGGWNLDTPLHHLRRLP